MLAAMLTRTAAALVLLVCSCAKGQSGPDEPPGGEKICTQIGCVDGLNVEVVKKSAWAPGAYTFAFTLDGEKVTCSGALPLKPCEDGPSLACDVADKVQVMESGCALEASAHAWGGLHVPRAVEKFEVTIAHEGQELITFGAMPKYTQSQPNGPGCEPVCNSAAERLELP